MKKTLAILLAVVMTAAALAGCGGSAAASQATMAAGRDMADMEPAEEAVYEEDFFEEVGAAQDMATNGGTPLLGEVADVAAVQRKLIRTVDLSLESREFDTALEQLNQMVSDLGGYIEYSDISGRSLNYGGDYYRRSANLTARIPAEKLTQATDTIEQLCNVTSRSESVTDISDNYYDVEGRLKTLRVEEERLLALLGQASQLEDMLTIESHLSEVRYQIESLTGQLNRYDSRVNYSTVNMYLQEVVEYTERTAEPASFGDRVAEAFEASIDFIGRFAQGAVLVLVSVLPFVLVYGGALALVVLVVIKIVRTISRKKKAKTAAPQPQNENEQK